MSKEKVLFVCHVEEEFRYLFSDSFAYDLAESIWSDGYDKVIYLESAGILGGDGMIEEIANYPYAEVWEWAWGTEPEAYYEEEELQLFYRGDIENPIVIDAWLSLHEWAEIPYELYDDPALVKRLQKADVYIAGGCDSECLADFRCVLSHLEIPYNETGLVF